MKNIGFIKIIALLVLSPLIIWEFALKNTYQLSKTTKQLEEQIISIKNTSPRLSELIISETSSLISNGELLKIIAEDLKKENVEIVSYQPSLINEDNNYKLYAGALVLSGTYINLVKLIDTIEKKKIPVKISSATFFLKTSKWKKSISTIELALIFQQIEN